MKLMQNNRILMFLKREGNLAFWRNILFVAIISGIANASLLAVINIATNTVENEGLNYHFFSIFFLF